MTAESSVPFFARLGMAFVCFFRILFRSDFALAIRPAYLTDGQAIPPQPEPSKPESKPVPPPANPHASGLFILSMLQREGRLIDFLQEDVATFSDADIGAAARVVHEGCRKVVRQYLALEPVLQDLEGAAVNVPANFDASRIRLTGNVGGVPPFKGALRHHGWVTKDVRFPEVPTAMDPKVLAPAEVELS